jgi:hypothetical protein
MSKFEAKEIAAFILAACDGIPEASAQLFIPPLR